MSMSQTRIVFMGTPDFAVPSLQALIAAPDFDVCAVVTQPDRPAGRGRDIRLSPVKQVALEAGIPTIQPEKLRRSDAIDTIRDLKPDFLIVVAYGQILPQEVLDIPRIMPINVHASLLPRWRGAAPIQAAIRAGDIYTGITTMQMDAGLDTGPILLQDSIPIAPTETGESLHDKLAPLGADLLIHTLRWLINQSIAPHGQPTNESLITYAPQIKKEDGEINWHQSAIEIDQHIRAYTPWPGTYTTWSSQRLKILSGYPLARDLGVDPGRVIDTSRDKLQIAAPFAIGTGHWVYVPTRLQLAGRQAMDAEDFLNGAPGIIGSLLGT